MINPEPGSRLSAILTVRKAALAEALEDIVRNSPAVVLYGQKDEVVDASYADCHLARASNSFHRVIDEVREHSAQLRRIDSRKESVAVGDVRLNLDVQALAKLKAFLANDGIDQGNEHRGLAPPVQSRSRPR